MTEYSVEKFYGEYALKKEDSIIAVIDSGTNARKVCDLLNEQYKQIKSLEGEIKGISYLLKRYVKFMQDKCFSFKDFIDWEKNNAEKGGEK